MEASAPNKMEVIEGQFRNLKTFKATFEKIFKSWEVDLAAFSTSMRYVGQCQIELISGQLIFGGTNVNDGCVSSSYPSLVPTINFPTTLSHYIHSQKEHNCSSLTISFRRLRGCTCAECAPKPPVPVPEPTLMVSLSAHLSELFTSSENADVAFELKARKPTAKGERSENSQEEEAAQDSWVEVPAHKLILCARVPYFKRLFKSGMKESTSGRIRIEDAEPEYFRQVLKFVYSGKLPEDLAENPEEYLPIADKYGIDDLKAASSQAAKKLLKKENVIFTLVMADLHQCADLKEECITRLKEWKAEMNDNAMDHLASYPRLMLEMLKKF